SGNALVRFDAAAAIHGPAGVGSLQLARRVRALDVLILEAVAQVLVEGGVPRPLDEAAARRVVMRRRQREPCLPADAIDRLHERFAEGGLADDVRTIVILQSAGD